MDLGLGRKVALVTGASRGIGLAIVAALAREGAQVVAGSLRGSPELDELARTKDVHAVDVDLGDPQGPAELVARTIERFGHLDILVNNVGAVRPCVGGFLAVTDSDWDETLTINLMAAVRVMRAAIPLLIEREGATIVTISSGSMPSCRIRASIDYSAAKAALANVCKSLSKEYGGRIRVNTISPGPVQTDLWLGAQGVAATVAQAQGTSAVAVAQDVARQSVTGRFTRPDEVADLVLFLASDRAANITGSDHTIDGGLITTL